MWNHHKKTMAYNEPCPDSSLHWLLILFQSPSGYDSWQRKEFSHIANLLKKFWQSAFPPLGNNYKQNQRGILEDYTTLLHKLLRLIIHAHSNIHFLTLLQFVFLKKEVFGFLGGGLSLKALTAIKIKWFELYLYDRYESPYRVEGELLAPGLSCLLSSASVRLLKEFGLRYGIVRIL